MGKIKDMCRGENIDSSINKFQERSKMNLRFLHHGNVSVVTLWGIRQEKASGSIIHKRAV